MTETKPTPDPFANLSAAPVEALFTGGGRPATPVPDSVMALIRQSYNGGKDGGVKLRVEVATPETGKELAKLLRKGGTQHDPVLTVRVADEKNDKGEVVALRFLAGPKVVREAKPEKAAEKAAEPTKAAEAPKAKAS